MVPVEVFNAAFRGDLAAIDKWLGEGGNPLHTSEANTLTETASILKNTRLAGHSYKRWVLKDYMALFRLRSLLSRGRARAGPETTLVAARLLGSLTGFDDVPGECFWRVVEYAWLGDWRHP